AEAYYQESEINTWRNSTTQEEMGWVHGITSDIQTQFSSTALDSEVLKHDGSVQLTGDWNFGDQTISGTGDIYTAGISKSPPTVLTSILAASS
ncbi:unnamed protein product, partial [marine sediment metagenome]